MRYPTYIALALLFFHGAKAFDQVHEVFIFGRKIGLITDLTLEQIGNPPHINHRHPPTVLTVARRGDAGVTG